MPSRRSRLRVVSTVLALVLGTALPLVATGAATAAVGSCTGFKNQTGITSTEIRIGNASDSSGPVPGLYDSARLATKAYVAYSNSVRKICGRKLVVDSYDSRTDAGSDQTAYAAICQTDFAAVGSMSAFDSGGAAGAAACGLPDLRAASVTTTRNTCSTCFGVNASRAGEAANSVTDFFVARNPVSVTKAALLYLNAGSSAETSQLLQKAEEKRGMTFLYSSGIDVAAFNYAPYVQQMKSKGVQLVQFNGAYQQAVRLAQAMTAGNFHPAVFLVGSEEYEAGFLSSGGTAVEGAIMPINFRSLGSDQVELNRYRTWLKKVSPTASPTTTGLFAWSAAKLFAEEASGLGGRLTRASMIAKIRAVTGWTASGLHAPMAVGTKHVSPCTRTLMVKGGKWVTLGGSAYRCSGVTTVAAD